MVMSSAEVSLCTACQLVCILCRVPKLIPENKKYSYVNETYPLIVITKAKSTDFLSGIVS